MLISIIFSFFVQYSSQEMLLYKKINDYRAQNGLPRVALCDSLSYVAKVHSEDLYKNFSIDDYYCSLHSWSNGGKWKGGCITEGGNPDWSIMLSKPKEIVGLNIEAYEISFMQDPKDWPCNPSIVLKDWINSPAHNRCILQKGWPKNFKRMGVGIHKGVATVWFATD